jgi:preprotein translocase subunit SecG
MLTFQKEQGVGNLPAQKPNAATGGSPGDGSEKSQDQPYLTVAEHGKRARNSTVLLAVLFIAGLLGLWFMIKKSTPQAASAADEQTERVQIEAAITRLTGFKSEVFGRMDEIVRKFYEFSDVLQVQVSELAKNPFRLEMFLAGAKEEPQPTNLVPEIDVENLWRQQIQEKAKGLELSGIMQTGRGNCCMVGSDILYQGDSVEGFKVREIGDTFVKLEWQAGGDEKRFAAQSKSVEIVLRLSE